MVMQNYPFILFVMVSAGGRVEGKCVQDTKSESFKHMLAIASPGYNPHGVCTARLKLDLLPPATFCFHSYGLVVHLWMMGTLNWGKRNTCWPHIITHTSKIKPSSTGLTLRKYFSGNTFE